MSSATARVVSALVLLPLLVALIWWAPSWLFDFVLTVAFFIAVLELKPLVDDVSIFIALIMAYLVFPVACLGLIRSVYGASAVTILIGIVVISDSAQYYTGRAFGRHKLAPVISPKKTVEGAIGGLVIASAAALGLELLWPLGLSALAMLMAGAAIAIAGMAGDLFESALKRRAGVKDSGNLIPGHGGILDRIDSWLFAAPVFWLILKVAH